MREITTKEKVSYHGQIMHNFSDTWPLRKRLLKVE